MEAKNIYGSPKILKSIRNIVQDSLFVGISTNVQVNSPLAIWLFDNLRDMNILSIWGGVYPTINPDECINHADVICRGEGEYAVLDLARKLSNGKSIEDIPNLWVKTNGTIVKNGPRNLIDDLDALPFPDIDGSTHYSLVPKENVVKKIAEGNTIQSELGELFCVQTTRGCPMICSYCSNKALDTLYSGKFRVTRKRSIESVIKELEIGVKKTNPKKIWFSDDIFTVRTEKELKLFSTLYQKNINLPFMCYVSPSTVSELKLQHLVDAGMRWVEMGVQSGSDYINQDIYERRQSKKAVLKAAKIINKFKDTVTPTYQFIMFNEYEREEDILDTINLIKQIPPPYIMQSFTLSLFKGSELFNRYVKDGYLAPDYKILTYTEADVAFRISINKMSNRKHYLYMLLWFMIQSARYSKKIMKLFHNDVWVNRERIPTIFSYFSSFVVSIIYKVVQLKRWFRPSEFIK